MENNIDLILAQLHMEEEELLLAGLVFVQAQQGVPRRRRQRRRRRGWIKPYLQRRPLFGQYENLLVELYREKKRILPKFRSVRSSCSSKAEHGCLITQAVRHRV